MGERHAPLTRPSRSDLSHIPHRVQTPFFGHTLQLLRDPYGFHAASADLGPVYKLNLLGQWRVAFAGLDAMEFILEDPRKCLSAYHGWDMIQSVFRGGLMLRDFDDHRAHRRIMQSAFRKPVMDRYRVRMDRVIPEILELWPVEQEFLSYQNIKALTLRVSTSLFMGLAPDDPRIPSLSSALKAEVAAGVGVIRKPLPGTAARRGLRARRYLLDTFSAMIPERRARPGGDFFSQMCTATDENGVGWSDADILDHFNFLMMAAHDTTASTLTRIVWSLAQYPAWQDRIRTEVEDLAGDLTDDTLSQMKSADLVLKEALRMMPPVPFIPRRTTKSFDWKGKYIPAGTWVSCLPGMVMMSPDIYQTPERFDPERFLPERSEHLKHKYAWAPFGGGAHKCIGMHFATLEAKLFLRHLLPRYRIELTRNKSEEWRRLPTPQPTGGLPVRLIPR
jgi:cytochrome P450